VLFRSTPSLQKELGEAPIGQHSAGSIAHSALASWLIGSVADASQSAAEARADETRDALRKDALLAAVAHSIACASMHHAVATHFLGVAIPDPADTPPLPPAIRLAAPSSAFDRGELQVDTESLAARALAPACLRRMAVFDPHTPHVALVRSVGAALAAAAA